VGFGGQGTRDPILTMDVLCLLSYLGVRRRGVAAFNPVPSLLWCGAC